MQNNKFYSMLGLCMKAGRLTSGEVGCEAAIKGKKAKLIIVAEDASENTKTKFTNSAKFYAVDLISYGNKSELGYALGKGEVVRRGKVRRAKLFYLRDRVGKKAKVKELVK